MIGVGALIAVWSFWFGYFAHDSQPSEIALLIAWPITLPLGKAVYWWQWGTRRHPLWRYSDLHWWQRGLKEKR